MRGLGNPDRLLYPVDGPVADGVSCPGTRGAAATVNRDAARGTIGVPVLEAPSAGLLRESVGFKGTGLAVEVVCGLLLVLEAPLIAGLTRGCLDDCVLDGCGVVNEGD